MRLTKPAVLALAVACSAGFVAAQSPADRYRAAQTIFNAHSQDGFKHDDSAAARNAMTAMWAAAEGAVLDLLAREPAATERDVALTLCGLGKDADCSHPEYFASAARLAPQLFVAADRSGEAGTVFLAGLRDGRLAVLWRIDGAWPQPRDAKGVLRSWKPENSGDGCVSAAKHDDFSGCGPLYAQVGGLPADGAGRPRFYVDAGYAQQMGATVLNQTSVWRWDGNTATLLWIDTYAFMIDQKAGTSFADGVLSIGEKNFFRSFYSCGSCEERQMLHRLRITPEGVEDLGKCR